MPMSREEANKHYLEIVHGYSGERGPINWPQKNSPPVPPLQPQSPSPKAMTLREMCKAFVKWHRSWLFPRFDARPYVYNESDEWDNEPGNEMSVYDDV
jgi:hypothetical protein